MKRPASGRAAARDSQDQAASQARPPEKLPLARPASLTTRGRAAPRSEEDEHRARPGAGTGRFRGRGAGQGSPAGHLVAERPSASAAALEGNTAPRTALLAPSGKGNGGTRSADTPDIEDQRSESVADGRPRGSNEDVPCSQLPFHDFSNESEKRSLRNVTDPLAAGQILVARLYGPDGSFNSEATSRVLDVRDFEQGPVLEDQAAGRTNPPEELPLARPETLATQSRAASGSPEGEHHARRRAAMGRGQGQGAWLGSPASHDGAKRPPASEAASARSTVPRTAPFPRAARKREALEVVTLLATGNWRMSL